MPRHHNPRRPSRALPRDRAAEGSAAGGPPGRTIFSIMFWGLVPCTDRANGSVRFAIAPHRRRKRGEVGRGCTTRAFAGGGGGRRRSSVGEAMSLKPVYYCREGVLVLVVNGVASLGLRLRPLRIEGSPGSHRRGPPPMSREQYGFIVLPSIECALFSQGGLVVIGSTPTFLSPRPRPTKGEPWGGGQPEGCSSLGPT